jgi:hypothetical protein
MGQLGSVRDDATVGRDFVTSGSSLRSGFPEIPGRIAPLGITNSGRVATDSLLAPNNLVNTSDSGSTKDILVDKINLVIGVYP